MPPIDFWDGWIPFSIAIDNPSKFGIREFDEESGLDESVFIEQGKQLLTESLAETKVLLKKFTSWEGDGSFYISSIPFPDVCLSELVFAVKQSNNGTTYVVAPAPYPHISGYLVTKK